MSPLDKFNEWYVRAIPETETGGFIAWLEPAAGAQHRWRVKQRRQLVWLLPVFAVAILFAPAKHRGYEGYSFETRFWTAVVATPLFGLLAWYLKGMRQMITLSSEQVFVGQGRGRQRIQLRKAALSLEERDGHPVLIIKEPSKDSERIYLAPNRVYEVREFLTKAGHLKG